MMHTVEIRTHPSVDLVVPDSNLDQGILAGIIQAAINNLGNIPIMDASGEKEATFGSFAILESLQGGFPGASTGEFRGTFNFIRPGADLLNKIGYADVVFRVIYTPGSPDGNLAVRYEFLDFPEGLRLPITSSRRSDNISREYPPVLHWDPPA